MLSLLAAVVMAPPDPYKQWGIETLEQIRRELYLPDKKLYAEQAEIGKPAAQPAFAWPSGVMLSALVAGAKVDRRYKPWLKEYADSLRAHYWNPEGPVPGFDSSPLPKQKDRYYDDNAWLALALIDTAEVLGDKKYLQWAEETFKFILSGEDNNLGGGLYWKENEKNSKHTCSNAPAGLVGMRLFEETKNKKHLEDGQRLYEWAKVRLQDPEDMLMWDSVNLSGRFDKTKWSYNTALMIRGSMLLGRLKKERFFSIAGVRMGESAVKHWFVDPDVTDSTPAMAVKDDAAFAHLLTEALLLLTDKEREHYLLKWDDKVKQALSYLHEQGKDANGHYGKRWEEKPAQPYATFRLIDQASAARAYFMAAMHLKERVPVKKPGK
jgi:hypothetical protein